MIAVITANVRGSRNVLVSQVAASSGSRMVIKARRRFNINACEIGRKTIKECDVCRTPMFKQHYVIIKFFVVLGSHRCLFVAPPATAVVILSFYLILVRFYRSFKTYVSGVTA